MVRLTFEEDRYATQREVAMLPRLHDHDRDSEARTTIWQRRYGKPPLGWQRPRVRMGVSQVLDNLPAHDIAVSRVACVHEADVFGNLSEGCSPDGR